LYHHEKIPRLIEPEGRSEEDQQIPFVVGIEKLQQAKSIKETL